MFSSASFKKMNILKVYFLGSLLLVLLFYIHTILIFDVAGSLLNARPWFVERWESHEAGKIIVLGCFIILFGAHLLEVVGWSLFLKVTRLVSSTSEGMYFVGVSISTLGYGDVVLIKPWRQIGPMIAIAGVIKFGCTTAFLFFVIQTVLDK